MVKLIPLHHLLLLVRKITKVWKSSCWILSNIIYGKQWNGSGGTDWSSNPGIAIKILRDSDNVNVWNTRDNVNGTTGSGLIEEKKGI